ncbi:MAG: kinesin-like protein Klp5 [Phylliscum demangeonii]|nr:MAG: kinesin-like protein Klp5 [Phylliscum demangeonii]
MTVSDGASSISVTVRVRPFTIREAAQLTKCDDSPVFLGDGSLAAVPIPRLTQKGLRPVIKVIDDKCLVFDPPEDNPMQRFSRSVVPNSGKRVKDQTFAFDRVFDENTTQADVYEATTRGLLDNVLDGYNATVFAYGATGCGKTHTITGTAQQPGIIVLAMQELFERIAERSADKETEVSLSYLEIYNETIRDLLLPGGSKQGLQLREDSNQTVSVSGLTSHNPQNVEEVMEMIMKGNECRTMSPTEANATSSRSHAVLQINVSQRDRNADVNEPHTMATLSIIDLAGSERASATKNRGERLLEGANINKSLLALGSCINALCDVRQRNHVPYRNSKLTRLLKFSLGGNCKTVMVVCVSPSSQHFDETQNTLRYANRAKNIQTKVTRNVYNVNRHVKDFLKKIDEQMTMINELKQQQKDYEATAFAKFRKQNEKRDALVRDGLARIRSAYDHSLPERRERIAELRKLRLVERRIGLLSAWLVAFEKAWLDRDVDADADGDEGEVEAPPPAPAHVLALRQTAQGILVELEGSRQHCHRRIGKINWERAIDSATQTGTRQLGELEGGADESHLSSLLRAAELLKAQAERDALRAVAEQDRAADAAAAATVVPVLVEAHFETMARAHQLLAIIDMDAGPRARDGAVGPAVLVGRLLHAATQAARYIVQPDDRPASVSGSVDEYFPPSRHGTPKRRKASAIPGPSPLKQALHLAQHHHHLPLPLALASPLRATPRKRRVILAAKKTVSFTPKKKPAGKPPRAVRWRDDVENGQLVDFARTPQRVDPSPEQPQQRPQQPQDTASFVRPVLGPTTTTDAVTAAAVPLPPAADSVDSSPVPAPPVPSLDYRKKDNRFLAGFLSTKKKGEDRTASASPVPTAFPPSPRPAWSSPLRDLVQPSAMLNRSPLYAGTAGISPVAGVPTTTRAGTDENATTGSPLPLPSPSLAARHAESEFELKANNHPNQWIISPRDALAIKSAVQQRSSLAGSGSGSGSGRGRISSSSSTTAAATTSDHRVSRRRRSPPGSGLGPGRSRSRSSSVSPPQQQHARRLGGGKMEKEHQNLLATVLSPRTVPGSKNAVAGRRSTVLDGRVASSTMATTLAGREPARLSAVPAAGSAPPPSAGFHRGSVTVGGKGVWK